jgi:hypothetical protein
MKQSFQPNPETSQVAKTVPAKSSAVKAGWICLILGFLTFWIFGFGFIFFVATFILAIVLKFAVSRPLVAIYIWSHPNKLQRSQLPSFQHTVGQLYLSAALTKRPSN